MKVKSLVNGIKKVETLRNLAFDARENLSNEFEYWDEEKAAIKADDKAQDKFEKEYHKLAVQFKEKGENANDYAEAFIDLSHKEFQEEVECK